LPGKANIDLLLTGALKMTKISYLFLLLLIPGLCEAQIIREGGLFAGTSYYMGDINPATQLYAPSPSFGAIYKINFNPRFVLRFQANYGQFRGSDSDFKNAWQQNRNTSFSASVLDINAGYEVNFLPYKPIDREVIFSPFLFVGIGYEFIIASQYNINNHISVPFGVGIKYMASKKITIGTEWTFRKTFQDNIDGVENPGQPSDKSFINNTDWYSFAGFFITFRLFDHSCDCPVYQ
jgi:hypothetical protein